MVLSNDLIRDVLLCIERTVEYQTPKNEKFVRGDTNWKKIYEDDTLNKSYHIDEIKYCIVKLYEAKLIDAQITSGRLDRISTIRIKDITWEGHELLNNIRDNDVWKEIRRKLGNAGKTSLSVIAQVAVEVAKAYALGKLGLSGGEQ